MIIHRFIAAAFPAAVYQLLWVTVGHRSSHRHNTQADWSIQLLSGGGSKTTKTNKTYERTEEKKHTGEQRAGQPTGSRKRPSEQSANRQAVSQKTVIKQSVSQQNVSERSVIKQSWASLSVNIYRW